MDFKKSLPATLYAQVTTSHPYRFDDATKTPKDHVALDPSWSLVLDRSCGPLAKLAADDLRTLVKTSFGVKLSSRGRGEERGLAVRVEPNGQMDRETYRLEVMTDRITITAADDDGAMRALFHLGWQMLNQRSPVLECGVWDRAPQWRLRITSPLLHRPLDQPEDYLELPESYLLNMARYGYNAMYLYADWFDYMTPEVGGPLARKGYRQRLAALRQTVEYLGRFGIRLLFHVNMLTLPADHPQFREHPRTRGAQTFHSGWHCLCSSNPAVIKLYEDAAAQLFSDVPGLDGAVLITGGECFLHCYTRPVPKTDGRTNCQHCAEHPPEQVIARIVNAFARGVGRAAPDAQVLMWPYSAFSWGDPAAQTRLVNQLDQSIAVLSAFEKDSWRTIDGVRSYIFDYSASVIGPSPVFRTLARAAKRSGHAIWAKSETSNALEMVNVPRIPIMQRWMQRYQTIRDADVTGVHTAWRFYGFCAQRTDEVVDYLNWAAEPDVPRFLHDVAVRDFGGKAASHVTKAWQCFSDAFESFPFSAGPSGFFYFRGPFFIGAAHPFLFDLAAPLRLSERFWTVDPNMTELHHDLPAIAAARQPTFFMDLTWTQPFGAEIIERQLRTVDRGWQAGLRHMEKARPPHAGLDRDRWQDEVDVSTFIGTMVQTALHLVRFQQLRELVTVQSCTPQRLRQVCQQARQILIAEHANAERALATVERQSALGYGATYGCAVDADLLREKLAHTQHQIDSGVPDFFASYMFHMFGKNIGL